MGDIEKTAQINQVVEQLDALDVLDTSPQIKYILDCTLNRLTRCDGSGYMEWTQPWKQSKKKFNKPSTPIFSVSISVESRDGL